MKIDKRVYIAGSVVLVGGIILASRRKTITVPTAIPTNQPIKQSFSPPNSPIKKAPMLHAPPKRSGVEREVLRLTNIERQSAKNCGGRSMPAAPALQWSDLLARSAAAHARDMAERQYFNHISLDGREPADRIYAAGFRGTTTGENIASGQATPAEVMVGWMKSPGHCVNIMRREYRYMGVGYFYTSVGEYHHYWVQNFGS